VEYIMPELLIGIPFLAAIGQFIKSSKIDNKHVPVILGIIGVIFAPSLILVFHVIDDTAQAIFTGIVQGVLIAAAAVYGHQIVKGYTDDSDSRESEE